MNKVFSIIKATISDISFTGGSSTKKQKNKVSLSNFWVILLLVCISTLYAFSLGVEFHKIDMMYVLLSIYSIAIVITTLISGIFKAGSLIYMSKNNDMLLSMPIKKSDIYLARVIKFLLYEYIQTIVIMIPAVVAYGYFEHPSFIFYISTLLYIISLPIIPVILSLIIGYLICVLSSKMKNKSIAQTVISFIFFAGIMYLSFSGSIIINNISRYAPKISSTLSGVYYPLKLYTNCILENSYISMVYLIVISVFVLLILVKLFSINYFKVISKLSEGHIKGNYKLREVKTRSKIKALLSKELKRYFGSSIYILNTIIFPIIIFGVGIYTIFANLNINEIMQGVDEGYLPLIIAVGIFMMLGTASTTCSSISMEGSKISILKSMPVKAEEIFLAKIIMNIVVMLPLTLLGAISLGIGLKLDLLLTILALIFITISSIFVAMFGLLINLKLPKLDALNDTVIVKQSASMLVNMFSIFAFAAILLIIYFNFLIEIISVTIYLCAITILLGLLTYFVWVILKKYGVKRFYELV